MHLAKRRQQQQSGFRFEVLSSLVAELVDHHERHFAANKSERLDHWQSPSSRTQVVRYGTRSNLRHALVQQPDTVAVEYQLSYSGMIVHCWHEYRWPHLCSDNRKILNEQFIDLPQDCVDELLRYHTQMKTSWLKRYRARSRPKVLAEFDKIRVVA